MAVDDAQDDNSAMPKATCCPRPTRKQASYGSAGGSHVFLRELHRLEHRDLGRHRAANDASRQNITSMAVGIVNTRSMS